MLDEAVPLWGMGCNAAGSKSSYRQGRLPNAGVPSAMRRGRQGRRGPWRGTVGHVGAAAGGREGGRGGQGLDPLTATATATALPSSLRTSGCDATWCRGICGSGSSGSSGSSRISRISGSVRRSVCAVLHGSHVPCMASATSHVPGTSSREAWRAGKARGRGRTFWQDQESKIRPGTSHLAQGSRLAGWQGGRLAEWQGLDTQPKRQG